MVGRWAIVAVLASVAAACTSSSNNGSASASDKSGFASQFCQILSPCCAQAKLRSDGVQCQNLITGLTSAYDATAGGACIDEMNAASKSATFCADLGAGKTQSCKKVFNKATGTAAPGDKCTKDSDCAPSTEGDVKCNSFFTSSATTQICQVLLSPAKEGDGPCVGTVDGSVTSYPSFDKSAPPVRGYLCDVANGLRCDSTSTKCARIQDVGGPCTSSEACVKTAYCNFTAQTCAAKAPVGGDCSTSGTAMPCVNEADCDATTHKCVARAAEGAACKSGSECQSRSCVNGACSASGGLGGLALALYCGGT